MRVIPVIAAAAASVLLAPTAASAAPTCADTLGISNHGQHIVGDYVIGPEIGAAGLGWSPAGQVGSAVSENGGAFIPGGPGPGFHFDHGVAPGASFCTGSKSPGAHP